LLARSKRLDRVANGPSALLSNNEDGVAAYAITRDKILAIYELEGIALRLSRRNQPYFFMHFPTYCSDGNRAPSSFGDIGQYITWHRIRPCSQPDNTRTFGSISVFEDFSKLCAIPTKPMQRALGLRLQGPNGSGAWLQRRTARR